jgi:hypothetical protein
MNLTTHPHNLTGAVEGIPRQQPGGHNHLLNTLCIAQRGFQAGNFGVTLTNHAAAPKAAVVA